MEFIARTVVHPNGRLAKQIAEQQLMKHPEFKPGTVIVAMTHDQGKWIANLHEPKIADAPPFGDDADSPVDGPPKDDAPKGDEDKPKDDDKSKNDNKDDETGEKISLEKVMDLVQQIAQAVGVPAGGPDAGLDGPGPEGGPEGLLDGPPPAAGPHPGGPEGGPPHDETSALPGSPDTKQIIHRKAPPGAVPTGAPAFASTKVATPKVATFDIEEETDMPLHQAREEIESIYGPYGYKVIKMIESRTQSGNRVVQARVSARHASA